MPLPVPNLDDRDYAGLLRDAKALLPTLAPEWTDLSPGDPGVALLELFAFLTESMLFRLNKLPDKAYVELLNLAGVTLAPPGAAKVELVCTVKQPGPEPVTIRRGTKVTTTRPNGPVFVIADDVTIPAGATDGRAVGLHCELVDDALGVGSGAAGQRFVVTRPPIVLDSGELGDLYVGVEAAPAELGDRVPSVRVGTMTYRVWREVSHFGGDLGDGYVFVVDRSAGKIVFGADGTAAQTVPVGRQVRAWYRSGGGAAGNVRAGTLTVLKDSIPGLSVVNPGPAAGGRDGETLAEALRRAANPTETLDRAVTARDYERIAVASSGGASRALAVSEAELWEGATPGVVRVLLLPTLDTSDPTAVTADALIEREVSDVVDRVGRVLAERQPLGVSSRVGWVGLKRFHVEATAVVNRAEDVAAVQGRLQSALARTLTPLPSADSSGWAFGEALRASTVYDVLLAEPGVRFVENVRLVVDEVPGDVGALLADPHQPHTWFCASDGKIFRSGDDAEGWELLAGFDGETIERLSGCPGTPGLVVASSRVGDTEASRIRVSADHGESWRVLSETDFHVRDVASGVTDGGPKVFAATDRGLFRIAVADAAVPEAVLVDATNPAKPCYAVAVLSEPGADLQLAVAAQELGGVYVSFQAGRSGTYAPVGLTGVDVRLLQMQRSPGRRFLLSGAFATGDEAGAGVSRLELLGYQPSSDGWQLVGKTWVGGSCRDLACSGEQVYAATARAAVCTADTSKPDAPWRAAAVDSGLPLREVGRFQPVLTVAAAGATVLSGCVGGVYESRDGRTWAAAGRDTFTERVSLPRTWLFAPSEHKLTVRYDDARS
jgi:hypothetical protein